jgi:carbonic anhydrase
MTAQPTRPTPASQQRPSTPDEAIQALLAGNQRYASGSAESTNPQEARADLAAGQSPFAGIIRCADSRVAPEIVFDQPLGQLFVCGVAGNIPTTEVIASLEYGVAVLGIKVILVMGHSSCGAVQAAIKYRNDTSPLPGSLPGLIDQIIFPCTEGAEDGDPDALSAAIECNANKGCDQLISRSPVIAEAVESGDLKVIAGVQDLASGRFTITRR